MPTFTNDPVPTSTNPVLAELPSGLTQVPFPRCTTPSPPGQVAFDVAEVVVVIVVVPAPDAVELASEAPTVWPMTRTVLFMPNSASLALNASSRATNSTDLNEASTLAASSSEGQSTR